MTNNLPAPLREIYDHGLDIAAKIGFQPDEIGEAAPWMMQILTEEPEAFLQIQSDVMAKKSSAGQVYALTRRLGLEDDPGMLAVCLLLTHASHNYYRERGIGEKVYLASMRDIRVWAVTCQENHHHLGLYEYGWITNFYTAAIVRLGRLEFHEVPYKLDEPYTACGVTVRKGDTVINIHIPADGPLTPALVEDSFRRAYRYFGRSGITPFVCGSWLLYPGNRQFCAPDSNIVTFMDCFTILEEESIPDSGDLWRVFGKRKSYDPDTLPETTTMQRNLKKHLQSGGTLGEGYGIFLHDGEKRCDR